MTLASMRRYPGNLMAILKLLTATFRPSRPCRLRIELMQLRLSMFDLI